MLVLTCQIGDHRLALDVRRVAEVVPRVRLQSAACGPDWLAGTFVYRGQVVPVVDLHRLVGAGECPQHLSSRIILVPHPGGEAGRLLGLLAARVADVRDVPEPAGDSPRLTAPGRPDLGPALVDGAGVLHLMDVGCLLPEIGAGGRALVAAGGP
jgi:chemotaxis-related protein WspB